MKRLLSVGAAAALAFAAGSSQASAQGYWLDLGINAGGSLHTANLGSGEGFQGGDAKFSTGWLLGSQFTLWPSSRIGLRANLNFSDRKYEADQEIYSHVNLWSGTGDLLYRLKAPAEAWAGPETLPYVALGLGRKWVNPAGDQFVCLDQPRNEVWNCVPFNQATGGGFALGEWKESFLVLVGLGADFRLSPHWLFRVEVNDRIYTPQVQAVTGFLGGNIYDVPDSEVNEAKMAHELGLQAGIHLALGMRGPTQMAAPPPPPPPPPAQRPPPAPPAPPPPPRVDDISVCVIDLSATGGMRMQAAQFRHATSDTVVAGTTQPIRSVVSGVPTAASADWYVRGTPFVMTMGRFSEEFVTYGQPQTVACNSLVYAGMVNGYPVFVNPSDIAAFRQNLQTAVGNANGDLAAALAANAQLRQQFDAVRTIYIPMDPIGPRMQALQRQEQVRKGQLQ